MITWLIGVTIYLILIIPFAISLGRHLKHQNSGSDLMAVYDATRERYERYPRPLPAELRHLCGCDVCLGPPGEAGEPWH